MNELFVMFLIYVVSILLTAVIWSIIMKKNEIDDVRFAVRFLLTGPVALCVTIWEIFSMHNARKRGDFS